MIAKGSGYVKGSGARGRLVAHLKYVEHRSRGEDESRDDRRIFDKDEDVVSRRDAVEDIMEHEHYNVAYHKIVLSPGEDEPVEDWREWTREIMEDLEEQKGIELHWYAVHHDNTEHDHVHVVLAGKGEDLETGEDRLVRMTVEDYQFLRESGHDHSDHEWYRDLAEWTREFEEQEAMELGIDEKERAPGEEADHNERGDIDH